MNQVKIFEMTADRDEIPDIDTRINEWAASTQARILQVSITATPETLLTGMVTPPTIQVTRLIAAVLYETDGT